MKAASIFLVLSLWCHAVLTAQASIVRLIEIKYDSVTTTFYSYNTANMLSEEREKHQFIQYHYNDKNQVVAVDYYTDPGLYSSSSDVARISRERIEWVNSGNTEKSSTTTYEYNNSGQVIKSAKNLSTSRYVYDKNNRIVSCETADNGTTPSTVTEYRYDKKGNLVKLSNYYLRNGDKQLFTEAIYTYDNKPNPYKTFNLIIPGKYTNPNNILKETFKNYLMSEGKEGEYVVFENASQYIEYNDHGYPVNRDDKYTYIYK